MSTPSGKKVDRIRQIVLLKQMLKKWRNISLSSPTSATGPSTTTCSIPPKKFRRRSCSNPSSDDDEDQDCHQHQGKANSRRIPAGCLAVYVGSERRRFVIPTRYLNLPVFAALLKQSEEEFGYQSSGALVLPCDVGFFTALLRALQKKEKVLSSLPLEDILRFVADGEAGGCSKQASTVSPSPSPNDKGFHTPLLHKTRA